MDTWDEDDGLFNNLEQACCANEIQFSCPDHIDEPVAARASGADLERMRDMPVLDIDVAGRLA